MVPHDNLHEADPGFAIYGGNSIVISTDEKIKEDSLSELCCNLSFDALNCMSMQPTSSWTFTVPTFANRSPSIFPENCECATVLQLNWQRWIPWIHFCRQEVASASFSISKSGKVLPIPGLIRLTLCCWNLGNSSTSRMFTSGDHKGPFPVCLHSAEHLTCRTH